MEQKKQRNRFIAVLLVALIAMGTISGPVWAARFGRKDGPGKSRQEELEEVTEETTEVATGILPADEDMEPELEDTESEETEFPHGTADKKITKKMLKDTPDPDYKIDKSMQADASEGKYNAFFLKDRLQTVSIDIDENNLNYLFQNAGDKPTVMTNSVTIGDKTIGYTGLKTKGSYTLDHAVTDNKGSDRFSLTINFGKYIKKKEYGAKQNFYGLRKVSFNNFFFDKSMLKEFAAWSVISEMGIPTPQYGLAKLYINGAYYGVYFMMESFDHSILEQYYNCDKDDLSSYLLKPENTSFHYDKLLENDEPLWDGDAETYEEVKDMLPTVMDWVKKLNQLSEGTDFNDKEIDVNSEEYIELLNQIMDVDETLRYFAVHSFLVQLDNMFVGSKNFGLYVGTDGKSVMVPWDYDLSFGCYFPSDSESTANYNLDAMYRITNYQGWGGKNDTRAEQDGSLVYFQFPLFQVIYQNKQLMEQYHTYMLDCSKIASIGGTTSFGTTYDPGYVNSMFLPLEDQLYEAAAEELAKNAKYMNGIKQPTGVKSGILNLSKIISMRAVGVYTQCKDIDTTVCGRGCSLSTLGNALDGFTSFNGVISSVDAKTCIFATADYKTLSASPSLTVMELTSEEEQYQKIAKAIGCDEKDSLVIYSMKDTGSPEGEYTLRIPLPQAYMKAKGKISFYNYDGGELSLMETTSDGNVFTGVTPTIKFLAIVQKGGNALNKNAVLTDYTYITRNAQIKRGLTVGVAVVFLGTLIIIWKIRKKKKSIQ